MASYGFSGKGRFLNDVIVSRLWAFVGPIYNECVSQARPVYSVFSIYDKDGCKVMYERLLLPFGQGSEVTQMVAAPKTTSLGGDFENKNLKRPEGHDSEYVVRSTIALGY